MHERFTRLRRAAQEIISAIRDEEYDATDSEKAEALKVIAEQAESGRMAIVRRLHEDAKRINGR